MIKLRLQRRGRKRRPYYHIVVADQRFPRDGRVIERLGRFDNVSENKQLTLDEERTIHWLKIGAQPSDTVRSLLKKEGLLYKMHLLRWGKSEEEIEAAISQWKEERSAKDEEKKLSRKERQKALLESEEKEYKKQLEQKAAEAARQAKIEKAAEEEAEAEAPAAEQAETTEASEPETSGASEPEVKKEEEAEAKATAAEQTETAEASEPETSGASEPEVKKEEEAEASDSAKDKDTAEATGSVSTDMTANEAIDHIKNTPLEELEGFVPSGEDRVTVQRAWENKKSE